MAVLINEHLSVLFGQGHTDTMIPCQGPQQGRFILHTHFYQRIVLEATSDNVCESTLTITRHYIATQDGDNLPLQDSDPSSGLVDYPFSGNGLVADVQH